MGKLGVTVGIVGGGSMGGAIARGLVESGELDASAVRVADSDPARVEALASCGIAGCADAADLLSGGPDVVILAVKPQVIGDVMADIAEAAADRLVISIAAGAPARAPRRPTSSSLASSSRRSAPRASCARTSSMPPGRWWEPRPRSSRSSSTRSPEPA